MSQKVRNSDRETQSLNRDVGQEFNISLGHVVMSQNWQLWC